MDDDEEYKRLLIPVMVSIIMYLAALIWVANYKPEREAVIIYAQPSMIEEVPDNLF